MSSDIASDILGQTEVPDLLGVMPVDMVLWSVFAVVLFIYSAYTFILFWHWREYGTGKFTTAANMFTYLGVSVGCLTLMALSATWYNFI